MLLLFRLVNEQRFHTNSQSVVEKNGSLPCFHTIAEPVSQQASADSATHQLDCHMRLEVASTPLVSISRSFHCTRHFTAA
jgi:hypothetical protein